MSVLDVLERELFPVGLNVLGVADPKLYDAEVPESRHADVLFPGTKSIIVLGSGGGALWNSLLEDLRRNPRGLFDEQHPFDAFSQKQVSRVDTLLGEVPRQWFFASGMAEIHLDFRVLAHVAGLGSESRLKLLMHPVYGLWSGLRAACFTHEVLPYNEPGGTDFCTDCDSPCITACHGGALEGGSWSVDRCTAFHHESNECESICHSRMACPVAVEHRYPPEERAYHYNRKLGREWIRAQLNVSDDPYEGLGPHWGTWKAKVDVTK